MSSKLNEVIEDHPHACGDKDRNARQLFGGLGSSPRVWGQADDQTIALVENRIIPTRVGTSVADVNTMPNIVGSSPRVWGQVNGGENKNDVEGIIPTRVGTRRSDIAAAIYGVGSSPRVWGQVFSSCPLGCRCGIIPTRVGTRYFNK